MKIRAGRGEPVGADSTPKARRLRRRSRIRSTSRDAGPAPLRPGRRSTGPALRRRPGGRLLPSSLQDLADRLVRPGRLSRTATTLGRSTGISGRLDASPERSRATTRSRSSGRRRDLLEPAPRRASSASWSRDPDSCVERKRGAVSGSGRRRRSPRAGGSTAGSPAGATRTRLRLLARRSAARSSTAAASGWRSSSRSTRRT